MNCKLARALVLALLMCGLAQGQAMEVICPEAVTIPCHQLEDLSVTGRPAVVGGDGTAALEFRDSTLARDSLVIRIWNVSDTFGAVQTCFQTIRLTPGRPRIAVLPLENLAAAEDGARVLVRLLAEAVASSPVLELVSAGKVDDALLRGRVRQPFLMDDDQRSKLATTLDAQYFVVGSLLNYQVYQDQYSGPIPMIGCALQLQRASDGKTVWSESLHAVGNDGEWLFGMGVEHDITRLGRDLAKRAATAISTRAAGGRCSE